MEQKVFTIDNYEFRVAKMNAIDVLAIQSQIQFKTKDEASNLFRTVLESMEFKLGDAWVAVKAKGREVYCPAEVETNVQLTKKLVEAFINEFLKPVFLNSNGSK